MLSLIFRRSCCCSTTRATSCWLQHVNFFRSTFRGRTFSLPSAPLARAIVDMSYMSKCRQCLWRLLPRTPCESKIDIGGIVYCPGRGSNSRPSAHRSFKHGQALHGRLYPKPRFTFPTSSVCLINFRRAIGTVANVGPIDATLIRCSFRTLFLFLFNPYPGKLPLKEKLFLYCTPTITATYSYLDHTNSHFVKITHNM